MQGELGAPLGEGSGDAPHLRWPRCPTPTGTQTGPRPLPQVWVLLAVAAPTLGNPSSSPVWDPQALPDWGGEDG